jgi:DEAD/DEAH box helicase domain-containing protein
VERIVAASHRGATKDGDATQDDPNDSDGDEWCAVDRHRVLPYRAGYEAEDRSEIQKALEAGELAGVVSTSAMELGIDIGEIDLVVLLNVPPTTKAFWQRVGRTGRHRAGTCLIIDTRGVLAETAGRLVDYVSRPLEPNWLYLENRCLQYANALCAAVELRQQDSRPLNAAPFNSLPESFQHFLANELSPADAVPPDLHALRQRAANPHHAFPLRSGIEQGFQVRGPHGGLLGSVTLSQALREAYPGAIYYYMARPYRAYRWNAHNGEILARREHHWTTRPIAQAMVSPRFEGGTTGLWRAGSSFVAEVEMQVRERVLGFVEQRGSVTEEHRYGPTSPFHDRELPRFFATTGVCWYFAEPVVMSDAAGLAILEAYCAKCGVQMRDLGAGRFHSKTSPTGDGKCQGLCIFDATHGSLRLTQRLAERFADVVEAAISAATRDDALNVAAELAGVAVASHNLRPVIVDGSAASSPVDGDRIEVIAPGERAMFRGQADVREVQVLAHRRTPYGLMYELAPPQPGVKWMVAANQVEPLYGETAMVRVNLTSGEATPLM